MTAADPWHLMARTLIDPKAQPPEPAHRGPYLQHTGAGRPDPSEHLPWRVDFEIPPERQRGTVRRFDAAGIEQPLLIWQPQNTETKEPA